MNVPVAVSPVESLIAQGHRLVFYPTKGKRPIDEDWPTREYTAAEYRPPLNVGLKLAVEIAPGRFLADVDYDDVRFQKYARCFLPESPVGCGRPSKRVSHMFYTIDEPLPSVAFKDIGEGTTLVEFRCATKSGGVGLQSLVLGVHPSGEAVTFHGLHEMLPHGPAADLKRAVTLYATFGLLDLHIGVRGYLHDLRLSVYAMLRQLGLSEAEALLIVRTLAEATGNDVNDAENCARSTERRLNAGDAVAGAHAVAQAIGETGRPLIARLREYLGVAANYPNTEVGDAECFAAMYGDRVRYDHLQERWLLLDATSGIWLPDATETLRSMTVDLMRQRQRDALTIADTDHKRQAVKWAIAGESTKRINNALREARAMPPVADSGEHWDEEPYLLGAPNGVIDLRTGLLRRGVATDRVTMRVAVPFDADAECPLWIETLDAIFGGDAEMVAFVQRAQGYSLTGDCREECLFLMYGSGGNGKGTFINTTSKVIADYADDVPFSTLERKDRADIPADVAKLVGKRLVTASESSGGRELNVERIKALTGRDPVTARFMRENFFTFEPVAKFWLSSNEKPTVRDDSDGFWRRVHAIPFEQSFVGRADMTLKDRLKAERAGILAWMVRGALAWQREGLCPPEKVREATAEYRDNNDPLSAFLAECCVIAPLASASHKDVFGRYERWCGEVGLRFEDRLSHVRFPELMKKRFEASGGGKSKRTVVYRGVGLLEEEGAYAGYRL